MKLVPVKNSVLCKRHGSNKSSSTYGLIDIKKDEVDLYEVLDYSCDDPVVYKVGDIIMSCSTGDELDIDGEKIYLFKTEHIMCVVK